MYEVEQHWIGEALRLARHAEESGDVPVGAVVVRPKPRNARSERVVPEVRGTLGDLGDSGEFGEVVGLGWNTREALNDPTGHAEIAALRAAAHNLESWRLEDCDLYVTLEPCTMCAGAIVGARVRRLVFGAWDPKAGAAGSVRDVVRDPRLNHQVEVIGGIREQECVEQLRHFFGRGADHSPAN